jgi:hypothetical protein
MQNQVPLLGEPAQSEAKGQEVGFLEVSSK